MKRILITGITGFLGANLVRYLGDHEKIMIFGHSRRPEAAAGLFGEKKVKMLPELSKEVIGGQGIDIIIHLAGIAHDLSGKYTEEDYFKVNHEKTAMLYDEFLQSGAKAFVFVSSVKAVIDQTDRVIDETFTPSPKSAYGKSKLLAEQYLTERRQEGKRLFILRPAMIHGPGNKGNLNLLYKFVAKGLPWPLGAFNNRRSFLSVDNCSYVMEKIIAGNLPEGTYMLADTKALSTNELIRLIGEETGKKVRIMKFPRFLITGAAAVGSLLRLPVNRDMLAKLTGDMVVSNEKLLLNLGQSLPLDAEAGLRKTIRSFNE